MTNPTKPAAGAQNGKQPGKAPAGSPPPASTAGKTTAGKPVPNRAQSKKIVNQRQTPWGVIIATVLIVALAVGVIGYAVSQNKKKDDAANPDKISGIVHKTF